ncbi:MAG: hypothetical protein HYR67_04825 [Bacteroidetes bacterium]|nr:hypothetical protein [Bacteroidota bacterium]
MKSYPIILLLLLISNEIYCQHEQRKFDRKYMKGEFKHFNLMEFNTDSLSENEKRLGIYHEGKIYSGQDVYYSSQKNERGLTEFTIYYFELGELNDGYRITYLIFDNNGPLISSFDVAYSLAESSENSKMFMKAYGKFLNESTYELTEEYGSKDENGTTISKKVIRIKSNGKIEEKKF